MHDACAVGGRLFGGGIDGAFQRQVPIEAALARVETTVAVVIRYGVSTPA
jgi:hypothetical protein